MFRTILPAVVLLSSVLCAEAPQGKVAPKPLYRDSIYDGAADPVVCWNKQDQKWFMFYTNRRANAKDADGVSWVHGTPIGIAESSDGGATWTYRCDANIGFKKGDDTYWAPEVIEHDGTYHMYLTYVPGIFGDWGHPRDILHLTSKNLIDWDYQSTLKLSSDRVIDACVFRLPDGTWRLWYNNERDGKSMYYADSPDLYTWQDKGKAAGQWRGEGPKVFRWKESYWMVVDTWDGLGVYRSDDALSWTRQANNLLKEPGSGLDDQGKGGHPDVVVSGDRAYLFYFTHPGRRGPEANRDTTEQRRSSIQVVELDCEDGQLACDRDKPTTILLSPPARAAEFNACDYGAVPDGQTVCTAAIQKTIDACSKAGGGTVVFLQPGTYMTGSIFLKDNVSLRVDKDVMLKGVQDEAAYPDVFTRVAGIETQWPAALINAHDLSNVKIYGQGTIDGSGSMWWDKYWNMRRQYDARGLRWVVDYDCKRPRLMLIYNAKNVSIEGLTLQEPGFWTVHICYSTEVKVDGLTIRANLDEKVGPSSDGIDIDSSSHVLVQNCDIDCNDDNFCLKAGRDADGLRVNRPTHDIVIRDCIARRGHGLITFGSETSGGIYNVEVYNLKAYGTSTGIRFKSTQGRGGTVRDSWIHNLDMANVRDAIVLDYDWYPSYNTVPDAVRKQIEAEGRELPSHWKALMQQVPEEQGTPYIRDIRISDIKAVDSQTAVTVSGRKNQRAGHFQLENVHIGAMKAGTIKNAENWTFKNVTIETKDGSTVKFENCDNMSGL
jgi:polygalacturonase